MTGYELLDKINQAVIDPILVLLMATALVVFIWGVMQFILNRDNEESVFKGKKHMLWGIIGLAIMVSVFGIIRLIVSFLSDLV